jgi:uncharacterized membrane protein (UPF0127 family)
MRTRRRPIFLFSVIALVTAWATLAMQAPESLDHFPQRAAEISSGDGPQRFKIWIADTPSRSEQGLMFVHSLAHDRGMLFPRNSAAPMAMWMKNTLIPLDMLFVDSQGQIIYIRHNATPQSEAIISVPAPMVTPAQAVLELAGGECNRRHISQGDRLSLS